MYVYVVPYPANNCIRLETETRPFYVARARAIGVSLFMVAPSVDASEFWQTAPASTIAAAAYCACEIIHACKLRYTRYKTYNTHDLTCRSSYLSPRTKGLMKTDGSPSRRSLLLLFCYFYSRTLFLSPYSGDTPSEKDLLYRAHLASIL